MTKRKSFLIAMSGGSGSGKSTLAEALLDHLPDGKAVMFGEDAYYHPMSFYGDPANEEERLALIATINYDAPASKEVDHLVKDLRALKSGQGIDQPIYDYDRHDRSTKTRRIEPAPVLILEGIHALSMPKIPAADRPVGLCRHAGRSAPGAPDPPGRGRTRARCGKRAAAISRHRPGGALSLDASGEIRG